MPFLILILIASVAAIAAAIVARRYPSAVAGAITTPVVEAAATGLALTVAFGVLVVGGAVLGLLAYLVRTNEALRDVDAHAAQWGHDHATGFSDAAIETVTRLGGTGAVAAAGLVVVAVEWRRRPNRFLVPFIVAVVAGDTLITTAVKALVDRARPTLNPIAATLGPSFPSGHTSTAAAFYAAAALILGRGRSRRARAVLAGGAVGVAIGVACSRVLLGVHWFSDVVAGLALGWSWFALCAIAFGGRLLRFGVTAERIERTASHASAPAPDPGVKPAKPGTRPS